MTQAEKNVLRALNGSENFENYFDNADAGASQPSLLMSKETGLGINKPKGYADFTSQIDVTTKLAYTNVATQALLPPAGIPALSKTGLPVYLFGQSDYNGSFAVCKNYDNAAPVWIFLGMLTYGKDFNPTYLQAGVIPLLNIGDLVIIYQDNTGTVNGYVIISCTNVAYTTLLASVSSDRFVINGIRMNVENDLYTGQFKNNIRVITQTLFGKSTTDKFSPASYVDPKNNIKFIADLPVVKGIDKNVAITTYMSFDTPEIIWSLFIKDVKKVVA